jgi:hypothetical protein
VKIAMSRKRNSKLAKELTRQAADALHRAGLELVLIEDRLSLGTFGLENPFLTMPDSVGWLKKDGVDVLAIVVRLK